MSACAACCSPTARTSARWRTPPRQPCRCCRAARWLPSQTQSRHDESWRQRSRMQENRFLTRARAHMRATHTSTVCVSVWRGLPSVAPCAVGRRRRGSCQLLHALNPDARHLARRVDAVVVHLATQRAASAIRPRNRKSDGHKRTHVHARACLCVQAEPEGALRAPPARCHFQVRALRVRRHHAHAHAIRIRSSLRRESTHAHACHTQSAQQLARSRVLPPVTARARL
jgi:hypothetical protein